MSISFKFKSASFCCILFYFRFLCTWYVPAAAVRTTCAPGILLWAIPQNIGGSLNLKLCMGYGALFSSIGICSYYKHACLSQDMPSYHWRTVLTHPNYRCLGTTAFASYTELRYILGALVAPRASLPRPRRYQTFSAGKKVEYTWWTPGLYRKKVLLFLRTTSMFLTWRVI